MSEAMLIKPVSIGKKQGRRVVAVDVLLLRLARLRQEWEEEMGGDMANVSLDLGLLFDDIQDLITQ